LFFRLLPKYSILMPNEDISSTRGKKKTKDCVSLIVCANASGTHKIPCVMIGKPKEPTCIKGPTLANSLFQSSESMDGCGNLLEMIQRSLCSRSQKTNMTSRSLTDG